MSETMPTTEAEFAVTAASREGDDERGSYELAFHVLPTVVEGEVQTVFEAVKKLITDANGEIFDEELPQRFDLAYEIVKHLEGKNRRFSSAYFGWIRFKADSNVAQSIAQSVEAKSEILRHLMIRLTRMEETNPFRFHEALAAHKQITNVDADGHEATVSDRDGVDSSEEGGDVDEEALEEALNKEEKG